MGAETWIICYVLEIWIFCQTLVVGEDQLLLPWLSVVRPTGLQTPGVAPEYFVDVLVVTDAPLYTTWFGRTAARGDLTKRETTLQDIKQYFTLVVAGVDARYKTLQKYNTDNTSNWNLTVRPVGFFIAETSDVSTWTERAREPGGGGQVDARRALQNLSRWVATTAGLPAHDHTMLFTGYDLVTDDSGVLFPYTVGRAGVATMCRGGGWSSSVMEDRGGFQSILTAAHELGHSLAAEHDGTGNTCSAADRYLMAGTTSRVTPQNLRHPWFFSPCSATEISTFVNRILITPGIRNCLLTALPQVAVPDITGVVAGQLYDPNQQCQHMYGPLSRYCHGGNFGDISDICTSMFCLSPNNTRRDFCFQHHAAPGTSCGDGRWCDAGECVSNARAPVIGSCPFGDQLVRINGQECRRAVAARPALCNNARVRQICCGTCRAPRSQAAGIGIPGCPVGDGVPGCRADLCQSLGHDGTPYARDCCGTCRFNPTQWTCTDAAGGVDGVQCSQAILKGGVQGCYNTTLAFVCCASCQEQRDDRFPRGCEYGNAVPRECTDLPPKDEPCTSQQRQLCCGSCFTSDNLASGSGKTWRPSFFVVLLAVALDLAISRCHVGHSSKASLS